jgi:hypothetical protein
MTTGSIDRACVEESVRTRVRTAKRSAGTHLLVEISPSERCQKKRLTNSLLRWPQWVGRFMTNSPQSCRGPSLRSEIPTVPRKMIGTLTSNMSNSIHTYQHLLYFCISRVPWPPLNTLNPSHQKITFALLPSRLICGKSLFIAQQSSFTTAPPSSSYHS